MTDIAASLVSCATTINSSDSTQLDEEERGRIEKVNELKRIFKIEEERKRRKELEEKEKRFLRKETCGSDDFQAFTGNSDPKAMEHGQGKNENAEEKKYSGNNMPLTPTTQYLTTATDQAKEGSSSSKEDDYSFELDSEDEFLVDVLTPYNDQLDDDNFDRKSTASTPARPYQPQKKKINKFFRYWYLRHTL